MAVQNNHAAVGYVLTKHTNKEYNLYSITWLHFTHDHASLNK